jgi:hypothetical protein
MSSSNCEFRKNRHSERHKLLTGINKLQSLLSTFRPIWVKFGTRDLYTYKLLRVCDFRENLRIENNTSVMGVNEISFTRVEMQIYNSLKANKVLVSLYTSSRSTPFSVSL